MKKLIQQNPNSQSGFTLIETLLYIGLFALVMTAILLATHQLIELADKSQTRAQIEIESQFVLNKIDEALNGASIVAISENNGIQTLNITNPSLSSGQSPVVITRDDVNSSVSLQRGMHPATKLNGTIAPVSSLDFVVTNTEITQTLKTSLIITSPLLATPQTYTSIRTIRKNSN